MDTRLKAPHEREDVKGQEVGDLPTALAIKHGKQKPRCGIKHRRRRRAEASRSGRELGRGPQHGCTRPTQRHAHEPHSRVCPRPRWHGAAHGRDDTDMTRTTLRKTTRGPQRQTAAPSEHVVASGVRGVRAGRLASGTKRSVCAASGERTVPGRQGSVSGASALGSGHDPMT